MKRAGSLVLLRTTCVLVPKTLQYISMHAICMVQNATMFAILTSLSVEQMLERIAIYGCACKGAH